jgi:hypothetical protein
MQTLSEGEWDIDRWTELLDSAKCFAEESGLQADSSRIDLLSEVDVAIQECDIGEEAVALLCMLGESVAIVPNDAASEADWSSPLVSELEKAGLQAIMTKVGETS